MAAPATSSSATRSSGRQKLKLQRLTSLARNARAGVCADDVAQVWALDTAAGEVLSPCVLEFAGAVSDGMRIRGQAAKSISCSARFWFSCAGFCV